MMIYVRCRACDGLGRTPDGEECVPCEGYGGFWAVSGPGGGLSLRLIPGDRDHRPDGGT